MFLISNARLDAFLFVMQKDTDLYLVTYAGNSLDTGELVAFLYYAVKDGNRVNPPVGFRKG